MYKVLDIYDLKALEKTRGDSKNLLENHHLGHSQSHQNLAHQKCHFGHIQCQQ